MLNGLYSAATAMDSATGRHEVIAHNLAYADHPGYRRRVQPEGTFELVFDQAQQAQFTRESLGTEQQGTHIDFTPGAFQQTGRSLDSSRETGPGRSRSWKARATADRAGSADA